MTTFDHSFRTPSLADLRDLLLWPVLAGAALGVGDLVVMTTIAYPWANLANSSAVWALGAFVLGAVLRTDPARSAIAGVVMLVVAVESYYAYAAALDLAGHNVLWSSAAQMWLAFGVVAGVVFGIAGSWTSRGVWWQRVTGSALGAAVLLGEALHTVQNLDGEYGEVRTELLQTAGVLAALGVVVLVLSARRPGVVLAAAAAAVPATFACAVAFSVVGIAY